MADKERLVEIVLGMVEDVNPAEIASHIARGNLHEWCRQWRETVGKYLADVGNSVTVHKTGHWKHRKSWDKYVCSECGYEHDEPHNYCPNPKCNAKMEGE